MPSTILSDNGASSGTAGIKTTGSNDGQLALQTTTAGGTATTALTIDTSQNVGIGTSSPAGPLDVVRSADGSVVEVLAANTFYAASSTDEAVAFQGEFYQNDVAARRAAGYIRFTKAGDFSNNANASANMLFATRNAGTLAERMRITSAGEVLVGGTTALPAITGVTSAIPKFSIQNNDAPSFIGLFRNDTSISSGDNLGVIGFYGNDTTTNTTTGLAFISAIASGTHAAGDNPTDLVFGCTNDGSETVDEFARLSGSSANSRSFTVRQPTLTNDNSSVVNAAGGTAGTLNRYASIATVKHSGITNACGALRVFAEDAAENWIWADNSDVLRISTTFANIGTTGGTVVGTQTSDERIKNIIGPVTYGLEQIKSINPVEYTLKDDVEQTKRIGFIAQQVQPIVPESVYDTKEVIVEGEPTKLGMEYVSLIPVLVNAVKELSAKCDALQAEVNQLKGN